LTEDDPKQRMAQLEKRIETLKGARQKPEKRADGDISHGELAWRMVIELVAGLGIGFGIGYGLDSLFGTLPILLVLFTLLGLAAGIQTMMRSAREVQAKQEAALAGKPDDAAETETKRD
jgi:ATP synthase protein I